MSVYPRFEVVPDNSGGAVIQSRGSAFFGKGYILGNIFWSGTWSDLSDFYTVELRERDPLKDDTAHFIAGTAITFDAAVRLAEEVLAERMVVA